MGKIRKTYCLLSLMTLIFGMIIYLLFRNINNIVLFSFIVKPEYFNEVLVPLKSSIMIDVLKYNIPDMLWFLSAILFFRFIWFYKYKIQKIYILCIYLVGFSFEILQISENIPGTFDWLDVILLCIVAFVESLLYKILILRRCL